MAQGVGLVSRTSIAGPGAAAGFDRVGWPLLGFGIPVFDLRMTFALIRSQRFLLPASCHSRFPPLTSCGLATQCDEQPRYDFILFFIVFILYFNMFSTALLYIIIMIVTSR